MTNQEFTAIEADIRAQVKAFAEAHPAMKVSFGYIGNLEPRFDDRSWRIFYTVDGKPLSMGGYCTWELAEMQKDMPFLLSSLGRVAQRFGV